MQKNEKTASKTLFSGINNRIHLDREEGDYAYFHALMLKLEFLTKIVASGVIACVGDDVDRNRYSLEHRLVRANSLGTWVDALNTALVGPPAQSLISGARDLVRDLTEQVGSTDWRHMAVNQLNQAARRLDTGSDLGGKIALRRFFDIGTQLRNRTRGHGAPTASQCSRSCEHLEDALELVIQNMEILNLPWVHLHKNLSGKYRVSSLLNDPSPFNYLKKTSDARLFDGVYLNLLDKTDATNHLHVALVFTTPELLDIWLPNGNYKSDKSFEVLSYVSNDVRQEDGAKWQHPPARLPKSETEGATVLDLMGNTFANVPPIPTGYVTRSDLERCLGKELLNTDRHPIVTLTGPGGIGKTTIAIKAIREISQRESPPYDVILWISARDVDLLDAGPKPVSRRVFTQYDIACAAAELLEPTARNSQDFDPEKFFQDCLANNKNGPTLFVLDNFETLKNPTDVVEWVDTYIRPPNKILITTRFRNFQGDYAIKIAGMSEDEANTLIDEHALRLGVSRLIKANYKRTLIDESEGHPYVIKILLGQVAKEGRAVAPGRVVATSDHLLDTLFKRTYDALSPGAQRVFLLLCSWKVYVPEVAVEAVALRPETERFDVAGALEEVVRFSLVDYSEPDEDEGRFVGVPLAAAIFGQNKLQVSPFKVAVEEDRKLLMDFGAGKREDAHRGTFPRIDNLIRAVATRASTQPEELGKAIPVLEYLATRFPKTYLRLADLVLEVGGDKQRKEKARNYMRNYLESPDMPEKHSVWLSLAQLCEQCEDTMGEVHALCEAALLPTSEKQNLGHIANRLNNRIRDLKHQKVEDAWSKEVRDLLRKVIQKMENNLGTLSATDCSRLAWLHLNVSNSERALDVAQAGIKKEPTNDYCQRLIEKLQSA